MKPTPLNLWSGTHNTPRTVVFVSRPTRTFTWPLYQKPSLWRWLLRFLRG